MTIQNILAAIGCGLIILWLVLRYVKISGSNYNLIALLGLVLLIASLFFS